MDDNISFSEFVILIEESGDSDDHERDTLTRSLRERLEESDVESVSSVSAEVPEGAKSADAVTIGALAVTLLPIAVPRVIDTVKAWMLDRKKHPLKITFSNKNGDKLSLQAPSGVITGADLDKILALVKRPTSK